MISGIELASYSDLFSKNIKCNDNSKASIIVYTLMNMNITSPTVNVGCNGINWIVGNCQNIPSVCAGCTSLCNDKSTNSINIGQYPLACGYSKGCYNFMFVRLNSTSFQISSNFESIGLVVATSNTIDLIINLSGPATVICSAYLDLIDPINPHSVSNTNITNDRNSTYIAFWRY